MNKYIHLDIYSSATPRLSDLLFNKVTSSIERELEHLHKVISGSSQHFF